MKLETKAALAALIAGLFVVGASYGVSALVTSHQGGVAATSAASAQMGKGMGRMSARMGPNAADPQQVATGRGLFTKACSSCHGGNAQGAYGPSLHALGLPDPKIAAVIRNGVKGKMPAYGGKYSDPQQQALVAYVQSLK